MQAYVLSGVVLSGGVVLGYELAVEFSSLEIKCMRLILNQSRVKETGKGTDNMYSYRQLRK